VAKRLFDVVVAAFGLLLVSPLLLLAAIAIKLDSPGPVFFRQERVGRHGVPFRIFKLRTMTVQQAPGLPQVTAAGDARVTRIGAWLRRWKLDELPQLIDVLRGTMSLVGPRPEVPRYVEHYPPEWRARLLAVRPGITDFASVRYRDEGEMLAQAQDPEREYIDVVLPTKLRYALRYVDNPSLARDLHVLGLTLRTVFAPSPSPTWSLPPMTNDKLWTWLDQAMSAVNPRNRLRATVVDALVVLGCWHVTYLFRLGFERWQPGRPWYDDWVSLGVVLTYLAVMALAGVPRGLWRFFGFDDFRRIAASCAVAGLLSASAVLMLQLVGVARAVLLLHPLFTLLALCLVRMAYRMVWEHARSRTRGDDGEPRRAIVLGAGEAGRQIVGAIHRRDGWTVLALLDDDPAKQGLRIGGITVQGPIADLALPHILAGATHVIVAMPGVGAEERERVLQLARHTGLAVLSVPGGAGLRPEDA
jgi:lipopolysaccharide/colanic/teichoic acid biosynthesis glycosyltransferase